MTEILEIKGKIPKLRFPEFRERPFGFAPGGEHFRVISDRDHHSDLPILAITQEQGAIPRELIDYNVSVTEESLATYKVVREGDFIISLRSFQGGIERSRYTGLCSPAYIVLRATGDIDAEFFRHYFKTRSYVTELNHELEGLRDGKMISYTQFSRILLPVPTEMEQRKIAECLQSLDELIAAEMEKLEALKRHKKGLLQQLFPAEGETTPRLRFPQFRDAGEWRQTCVGDLLEILSGFPFDGEAIVGDKTGVPLLRGINITEGEIRHNDEIDRYFLGNTLGLDRFRLLRGDLLIGMDGSKVGKNSALIDEADEGALLIQRVARLRSKHPFISRFVFLIVHSERFHQYVDRINTSSGIPHISAKQIAEFSVVVPPPLELETVVHAIETLQSSICGCQRSLIRLRNHKAALMQQLFPSLDELDGPTA